MAITVEHGPRASSFAGQLYGASAAQSYADQLLPFVGQYSDQQHRSGEAHKQREWQTGESSAQRNWQSGESHMDRSQLDKQLVMQALMAQYQGQQQEALTRLQTGRVLNPQPTGYTRGGQSNVQHVPQYGFPQGVNYQQVLGMQADPFVNRTYGGGGTSMQQGSYGYR